MSPERRRSDRAPDAAISSYCVTAKQYSSPAPPVATYAADLSYLGTFAADRLAVLDCLIVDPARRRPAPDDSVLRSGTGSWA